MTPDQQQKIITIAEYDGWVEAHDSYYPKGTYKRKINDSDWKHENIHFLEYDKLDSLLMPVARKIYKEIQLMLDVFRKEYFDMERVYCLKRELLERKITILEHHFNQIGYNFHKTTYQLFDSIYHAIELLNTFKAVK